MKKFVTLFIALFALAALPATAAPEKMKFSHPLSAAEKKVQDVMDADTEPAIELEQVVKTDKKAKKAKPGKKVDKKAVAKKPT